MHLKRNIFHNVQLLFALFCGINLLLINPALAQGCKTLKISGSYQWNPYLYINKKTNRISGVSYELLKLIGKRINRPLQFKTDLPWKRVLRRVKTGHLNIAASAYWNKERAQKFHYSIPFSQDEIRVFVLKSKQFPFRNWGNLVGRKGGKPLGASYGQKFDAFAKRRLDIYEHIGSHEKHFQMLLSKRFDYFISAHFDISIALRRAGLQHKIIPLPKPLIVNKVYFLITKQAPCNSLLPEINESIRYFEKRGTIKKLFKKYRYSSQFRRAQ